MGSIQLPAEASKTATSFAIRGHNLYVTQGRRLAHGTQQPRAVASAIPAGGYTDHVWSALPDPSSRLNSFLFQESLDVRCAVSLFRRRPRCSREESIANDRWSG